MENVSLDDKSHDQATTNQQNIGQHESEAAVDIGHQLGTANDTDIQYELRFDFTGMLKSYGSSRWKSLFKIFLYGCGIFLSSIIIGIGVYVLMSKNLITQPKIIPGVELVSEDHVIHFSMTDPDSYANYVDYLQSYIANYQQTDNSLLKNCTNAVSSQEMGCVFDMDELGEVCSMENGEYGYASGSPCVLLKVKRVKDWKPQPYTPLDELTSSLSATWQPDHVIVTCQGEQVSDHVNLGEITYYPQSGIPTKYFPYLNQEPYQDPLLFVRFANPNSKVTMKVTCQLWSREVSVSDREEAAVTFTLQID